MSQLKNSVLKSGASKLIQQIIKHTDQYCRHYAQKPYFIRKSKQDQPTTDIARTSGPCIALLDTGPLSNKFCSRLKFFFLPHGVFVQSTTRCLFQTGSWKMLKKIFQREVVCSISLVSQLKNSVLKSGASKLIQQIIKHTDQYCRHYAQKPYFIRKSKQDQPTTDIARTSGACIALLDKGPRGPCQVIKCNSSRKYLWNCIPQQFCMDSS